MFRDCEKFDHDGFRYNIEKRKFNTTDLKYFIEINFHVFDKHACMKRKYSCASKVLSMTKEIHEAIMKRSRLRDKFLKVSNQQKITELTESFR